MLRKIILPLVLLIFTQQEFCTSKIEFNPNENEEQDKEEFWESINNWVNMPKKGWKCYPAKLWWLWAFIDNVPFQYGGSKIYEHGEAYYGLSNGIGFFPSFLNFGWLKIGIVDAHINVTNLILDYIKNFIQCKTEKTSKIIRYLAFPIIVNLCFNIHIISFKILNCIKIKLVAPLTICWLVDDKNERFVYNGERKDYSAAWYITYSLDDQISWWYALLSPRIEINIPGIIDYFKGQ